jgi:hypothetical protein
MQTADDSPLPQQPVVASFQPIEQHAQTVARLSQQVDQACGAARHVTLGAEAYGVICAIIPLKLMPLQSRIAQVMRLAATELQATSDALRAVAANYEIADAEAAVRQEAITRGIIR